MCRCHCHLSNLSLSIRQMPMSVFVKSALPQVWNTSQLISGHFYLHWVRPQHKDHLLKPLYHNGISYASYWPDCSIHPLQGCSFQVTSEPHPLPLGPCSLLLGKSNLAKKTHKRIKNVQHFKILEKKEREKKKVPQQ